MGKRSKNLSLDEEAVKRGERYSKLHNMTMSQLINNFLISLPLDDGDDEWKKQLSPTVRRLIGIASGSAGIEDYHRHLEESYGR